MTIVQPLYGKVFPSVKDPSIAGICPRQWEIHRVWEWQMAWLPAMV